MRMKNLFLNFDSNPLTFDFALFSGRNSQNISKSSRNFSRKGRWDKALILKYLDSLVTEIFPHIQVNIFIN